MLILQIFLCVFSLSPLFAQDFPAPWKEFSSEGKILTLEKIFSGDDVVWGFDFIDSETLIFTEKSGQIKKLNLKNLSSVENIQGLPPIWAEGQGGLLDIRRHPTDKKKIFFSFSAPVGQDYGATALALADLEGNKLAKVEKIFSSETVEDTKIHFGSRIEFDGKGHLFLTVGDRDQRPKVQSLEHHHGKIFRLKLDGSTPTDNPFVNNPKAKKEIWSLGHRSPQGIALHPVTNELWESEMGPRGGDEINLIKPGKNYGWPEATFGKEYWGPSIGVPSKDGMEAPIAYWVPSISPSGIAFYSGSAIPHWKNNLFIGTLSGTHLRRLVLDGSKVKEQEILLKDLGERIRAVRTGPDGYLYFSTDSGIIARIKPSGK